MSTNATPPRLLVLTALAACSPPAPAAPDASVAAAAIDAGQGAADCAPGAPGVACLLARHAALRTSCDPAGLAALVADLTARRGQLPLWDAGTALFVADREQAIAGDFDDWRTDQLRTVRLCDTALFTATAAVPSGLHPYKVVVGDTWSLDPWSWSFAYDDFAGNTDGRNSLLATPDAPRGHLVAVPTPLCSTALGNCRAMLAYLPPGYDAPASATRRYPVLFMHDGQNVFDDHDCCFGHTGWEINVTLDAEIAAGRVAPLVVVAVEHGGDARSAEYAIADADGGKQDSFIAFQLGTVQPRAAALWRLDPARQVVAGSSFGGLIAMRLAVEHPDVYAGVASLSGAFWPGQDTATALRDRLGTIGKVPLAIYLDHGGSAATGDDDYVDNVAIRDQLVALGWQRADSPACARGRDALCYFHAPGATHDELAWRDRTWRFLRYFFGT